MKWEKIQEIKDEELREIEEYYHFQKLKSQLNRIDGICDEILSDVERIEITLFKGLFEKFARHEKEEIKILCSGQRFIVYKDLILLEEIL